MPTQPKKKTAFEKVSANVELQRRVTYMSALAIQNKNTGPKCRHKPGQNGFNYYMTWPPKKDYYLFYCEKCNKCRVEPYKKEI